MTKAEAGLSTQLKNNRSNNCGERMTQFKSLRLYLNF